MSGADVEAVCREAAMLALRDQLAAVRAAGTISGDSSAWKSASVKLEHFKRAAREIVADEAARSGMFYVNNRWLGGMLTNWKTVKKSSSGGGGKSRRGSDEGGGAKKRRRRS